MDRVKLKIGSHFGVAPAKVPTRYELKKAELRKLKEVAAAGDQFPLDCDPFAKRKRSLPSDSMLKTLRRKAQLAK